MLSIPINPTFLGALYTGQAIWHCAAFAHFGLWPEHTMLTGTTRSRSKDAKIHSAPGGDDWHRDLFRYLSYINPAFAVLAGLRLYRVPSTGSEVGDAALDVLALAVLGWANGLPAYRDLRIRKDGRWELKGFEIITAMDTAFCSA
jgi:hypothetical protein